MENNIKLTNVSPKTLSMNNTSSQTMNLENTHNIIVTTLDGTKNYEELENKPLINNIELLGNKTLEELGIQPKGEYAFSNDVPTKVSELENDSGYLTEHQDLSDYALKSDVPSIEGLASEEYVDNAIETIELTPGPQGPKGDKGDTGPQGNDYVLTSTDKEEIANLVLDLIPSSEGVSY